MPERRGFGGIISLLAPSIFAILLIVFPMLGVSAPEFEGLEIMQGAVELTGSLRDRWIVADRVVIDGASIDSGAIAAREVVVKDAFLKDITIRAERVLVSGSLVAEGLVLESWAAEYSWGLYFIDNVPYSLFEALREEFPDRIDLMVEGGVLSVRNLLLRSWANITLLGGTLNVSGLEARELNVAAEGAELFLGDGVMPEISISAERSDITVARCRGHEYEYYGEGPVRLYISAEGSSITFDGCWISLKSLNVTGSRVLLRNSSLDEIVPGLSYESLEFENSSVMGAEAVKVSGGSAVFEDADGVAVVLNGGSATIRNSSSVVVLGRGNVTVLNSSVEAISLSESSSLSLSGSYCEHIYAYRAETVLLASSTVANIEAVGVRNLTIVGSSVGGGSYWSRTLILQAQYVRLERSALAGSSGVVEAEKLVVANSSFNVELIGTPELEVVNSTFFGLRATVVSRSEGAEIRNADAVIVIGSSDVRVSGSIGVLVMLNSTGDIEGAEITRAMILGGSVRISASEFSRLRIWGAEVSATDVRALVAIVERSSGVISLLRLLHEVNVASEYGEFRDCRDLVVENITYRRLVLAGLRNVTLKVLRQSSGGFDAWRYYSGISLRDSRNVTIADVELHGVPLYLTVEDSEDVRIRGASSEVRGGPSCEITVSDVSGAEVSDVWCTLLRVSRSRSVAISNARVAGMLVAVHVMGLSIRSSKLQGYGLIPLLSLEEFRNLSLDDVSYGDGSVTVFSEVSGRRIQLPGKGEVVLAYVTDAEVRTEGQAYVLVYGSDGVNLADSVLRSLIVVDSDADLTRAVVTKESLILRARGFRSRDTAFYGYVVVLESTYVTLSKSLFSPLVRYEKWSYDGLFIAYSQGVRAELDDFRVPILIERSVAAIIENSVLSGWLSGIVTRQSTGVVAKRSIFISCKGGKYSDAAVFSEESDGVYVYANEFRLNSIDLELNDSEVTVYGNNFVGGAIRLSNSSVIWEYEGVGNHFAGTDAFGKEEVLRFRTADMIALTFGRPLLLMALSILLPIPLGFLFSKVRSLKVFITLTGVPILLIYTISSVYGADVMGLVDDPLYTGAYWYSAFILVMELLTYKRLSDEDLKHLKSSVSEGSRNAIEGAMEEYRVAEAKGKLVFVIALIISMVAVFFGAPTSIYLYEMRLNFLIVLFASLLSYAPVMPVIGSFIWLEYHMRNWPQHDEGTDIPYDSEHASKFKSEYEYRLPSAKAFSLTYVLGVILPLMSIYHFPLFEVLALVVWLNAIFSSALFSLYFARAELSQILKQAIREFFMREPPRGRSSPRKTVRVRVD